MRFSIHLPEAGRALGFVAVLVLPVAGRAQAISPTILALHRAAPAAIELHLTADDQHRRDAQALFHRRRTGGAIWSLVGGLLFAGGFANTIGLGIDVVPALAGGLIQAGIPLGIGLGKLNRFSRSRENEALGAYDNSGAFPRYVERRID